MEVKHPKRGRVRMAATTSKTGAISSACGRAMRCPTEPLALGAPEGRARLLKDLTFRSGKFVDRAPSHAARGIPGQEDPHRLPARRIRFDPRVTPMRFGRAPAEGQAQAAADRRVGLDAALDAQVPAE